MRKSDMDLSTGSVQGTHHDMAERIVDDMTLSSGAKYEYRIGVAQVHALLELADAIRSLKPTGEGKS